MTDDRKQIIAELKRQPGFHAWKAWALEIRGQYFTNLANDLYAGKTITPEDLAFKRGYFRAIARMFNEVDFSVKEIEADLQRSEVNELD